MPLVYESRVTLRPRHRVQGKHVVKKSQENGLLQTGGERGGGWGRGCVTTDRNSKRTWYKGKRGNRKAGMVKVNMVLNFHRNRTAY